MPVTLKPVLMQVGEGLRGSEWPVSESAGVAVDPSIEDASRSHERKLRYSHNLSTCYCLRQVRKLVALQIQKSGLEIGGESSDVNHEVCHFLRPDPTIMQFRDSDLAWMC